MVIKIERKPNEQYPSIAALVKALNEATFAAKRPLPIVGGQMHASSCISTLTITRADGRAWEPNDLSQKPYGIYIE